MTSKSVEIVPPFHCLGNGIPSAAIRWPGFEDWPSSGRPFGRIFRHPDRPSCRFHLAVDLPAYAGTGLRRRSSIRLRIFRNSFLGTATSANWNVKYRPWRMTFAPILTTLDRLCRSSPQRGQRPILHRLGQGERAQEVGEIVGPARAAEDAPRCCGGHGRKAGSS